MTMTAHRTHNQLPPHQGFRLLRIEHLRELGACGDGQREFRTFLTDKEINALPLSPEWLALYYQHSRGGTQWAMDRAMTPAAKNVLGLIVLKRIQRRVINLLDEHNPREARYMRAYSIVNGAPLDPTHAWYAGVNPSQLIDWLHSFELMRRELDDARGNSNTDYFPTRMPEQTRSSLRGLLINFVAYAPQLIAHNVFIQLSMGTNNYGESAQRRNDLAGSSLMHQYLEYVHALIARGNGDSEAGRNERYALARQAMQEEFIAMMRELFASIAPVCAIPVLDAAIENAPFTVGGTPQIAEPSEEEEEEDEDTCSGCDCRESRCESERCGCDCSECGCEENCSDCECRLRECRDEDCGCDCSTCGCEDEDDEEEEDDKEEEDDGTPEDVRNDPDYVLGDCNCASCRSMRRRGRLERERMEVERQAREELERVRNRPAATETVEVSVTMTEQEARELEQFRQLGRPLTTGEREEADSILRSDPNYGNGGCGCSMCRVCRQRRGELIAERITAAAPVAAPVAAPATPAPALTPIQEQGRRELQETPLTPAQRVDADRWLASDPERGDTDCLCSTHTVCRKRKQELELLAEAQAQTTALPELLFVDEDTLPSDSELMDLNVPGRASEPSGIPQNRDEASRRERENVPLNAIERSIGRRSLREFPARGNSIGTCTCVLHTISRRYQREVDARERAAQQQTTAQAPAAEVTTGLGDAEEQERRERYQVPLNEEELRQAAREVSRIPNAGMGGCTCTNHRLTRRYRHLLLANERANERVGLNPDPLNVPLGERTLSQLNVTGYPIEGSCHCLGCARAHELARAANAPGASTPEQSTEDSARIENHMASTSRREGGLPSERELMLLDTPGGSSSRDSYPVTRIEAQRREQAGIPLNEVERRIAERAEQINSRLDPGSCPCVLHTIIRRHRAEQGRAPLSQPTPPQTAREDTRPGSPDFVRMSSALLPWRDDGLPGEMELMRLDTPGGTSSPGSYPVTRVMAQRRERDRTPLNVAERRIAERAERVLGRNGRPLDPGTCGCILHSLIRRYRAEQARAVTPTAASDWPATPEEVRAEQAIRELMHSRGADPDAVRMGAALLPRDGDGLPAEVALMMDSVRGGDDNDPNGYPRTSAEAMRREQFSIPLNATELRIAQRADGMATRSGVRVNLGILDPGTCTCVLHTLIRRYRRQAEAQRGIVTPIVEVDTSVTLGTSQPQESPAAAPRTREAWVASISVEEREAVQRRALDISIERRSLVELWATGYPVDESCDCGGCLRARRLQREANGEALPTRSTWNDLSPEQRETHRQEGLRLAVGQRNYFQLRATGYPQQDCECPICEKTRELADGESITEGN